MDPNPLIPLLLCVSSGLIKKNRYIRYSSSKRVYQIRRKVCNRWKEAFPTL